MLCGGTGPWPEPRAAERTLRASVSLAAKGQRGGVEAVLKGNGFVFF